MIYINDVQLFVTFQRKSTKTQFWSDVTKISWTQKPCSYVKLNNWELKSVFNKDKKKKTFTEVRYENNNERDEG